MNVNLKIVNPNAIVPDYKSKGAAGFDFHTLEDFSIAPKTYAKIPTGLAFEIPEGYELEIRSRSGLAFKQQLFAYNGTIDSDYRGEVVLLLYNDTDDYQYIKKGDRIAQGIIKKIEVVHFNVVQNLKRTERGEGGFGSTGQ